MGRQQIDHIPKGDPCPCGWPFEWHRVGHRFIAAREDEYRLDECVVCKLPARNHKNVSNARTRIPKPKSPLEGGEDLFMGIDGEGCGRAPHRYVMLCTRDELGTTNLSIEDERGLSTEQCLDFLLDTPDYAQLFGYAFGYDLTKWLKDLTDSALWYLNHPELRIPKPTKTNKHPRPMPVVYKVSGKVYYLNLLSSRFDVMRVVGKTDQGKPIKRRRVIWDIFKFFGTSFVKALIDWDVGTKEARERIQLMKDKRGLDNWMSDPTEVKAAREYCFDECYFLGMLARKLVNAHKDANLELTKFFGAGSSADAMLKSIGTKEKIVREPKEMRQPIMAAFFGGRFENSVIGEVPGPLYNIDIASAYPYQITFLPCLLCGEWARTYKRNRIEQVRNALVRYKLHPTKESMPWGPLPFRMDDGPIVYPSESGGGWVWRDEFLVAEKYYPNIEFVEAYLLDSDCDCRPFEKVPEWYKQRTAIGKEGAGLVFKLGPNSIYGKLAQSIGEDPPYQSWTWAGLTTSGTRAQLMEAVGRHLDRANVLSLATDGIISRELIQLPEPRDTGTSLAKKSPKEFAKTLGKPCETCGTISCDLAHKPLGSWERKRADAGVFFARPGIYFDNGLTSDDKIRARGISRKVLVKYIEKLREAWTKGENGLAVSGEDHARFQGMKSCIRRNSKGIFSRSPYYGEWHPMPVIMSFNPLPKRDGIRRIRGKTYATLDIRKVDMKLTSIPYKQGMKSPERLEYEKLNEMLGEQPDVDEYGDWADD